MFCLKSQFSANAPPWSELPQTLLVHWEKENEDPIYEGIDHLQRIQTGVHVAYAMQHLPRRLHEPKN